MSSQLSSTSAKSFRFFPLFVAGLLVFSFIQLYPTLILSSYAEELHIIQGVVSSDNGQGIQGATVALSNAGVKTKTDRFGKFKLSTTLKGALRLQVRASGYQSQVKSIMVTSAFTNVMITLKSQQKQNKQKAKDEAKREAPLAQAKPTSRPALAEEAEPASDSIVVSKNRERAPSPKRAKLGRASFGVGGLGMVGTGAGGGGAGYGRISGRRGKGKARRRPRRAYLQEGSVSMMHSSAPIQAVVSQQSSAEKPDGDEYKKIDENGFKDPKSEPLSTLSIDVDTASYSNLRRFIQNGQFPPKDSVKLEEMINYFDYNYQAPTEKDKHPFSVTTELAEAPWNPKHKLMHIGLQGRKIDADKLPPSNLVFLLDVSGSMNGPDRLPLLKQALMLLSGTLRAQDKVSIVVYAGSAGLVLPPTSGSERRKIIEAFSKLRAGGSTAGGAGIKLAYKLAKEQFIKGGNNRVILATDGDFNVGVRSQAELVRLIEKQRKSGVFLTVLGFGRGNYRSSTMSDLAEKGNGNHAYIDSILEAQKVLVSEMGGTLFTIAKDVKIQVEFNPLKVGRYRLLGYQSRILAAADFNNDKKDAGELGAGHSVTALYELIPPEDVAGQAGQVDQLKYQEQKTKGSDEWLTVKLRYKKPDGDKSTLMTHPHLGDHGDWREASEDFRFSAGVASFGMMLRDSKHLVQSKRSEKWNMVTDIIKGSLGKDQQGYRSELLDLVKRAEKLKP